ncbi:MAG: hypothetical protein AB1393_13265 [Candidatus Edwardsbacteria bacterium]
MKTIYKNDNFEFKGFWNCVSKCGVQVDIERCGDIIDKAVVTLTELPDNPGTSITDAVEIVATEVYRRVLGDVPPNKIEWIEHYPASEHFNETFDKVILGWKVEFYSQRWQK